MENVRAFKTNEGRNEIIARYEAFLKRWPVPYKEINIKTRYGNTFIIVCGDKAAPPLVLIHGSGSNSAIWAGDIQEFCKTHCVYAIDIPGDAGKSDDNRQDLNSSAYREWLEDIFEALGLQRAAIAGVSLGGWMALKFATAHPEMVERLVLVCPAGIGRQKISYIFRTLPLMLLGSWGEKMMIRFLSGKEPLDKEAVDFMLLIKKNFNYITSKIPVFSDNELDCLNMPVLLAVGSKDTLLDTADTLRRAEQTIKNLRIQLYPEAGHILVGITNVISSFLNG